MSSIKELKSHKIKFKNDFAKFIEITNLLGHKYRECGRYNEAIEEHMEAITNIYKRNKIKKQTINCELEAVSRRALGECYSEMSKHVEALNEHKLYLTLAIELNDPIEIQRAHATIGRTYLLWGQEESSYDSKTNCDLLKKALASFQKALELCENLMSMGKLKQKEYAEMKSRLLLNLGLVHENIYDFDKCKTLIEDSITLTKANFLLDELFRCQISMGSIHEKTDSFVEAVYYYEEAFKTAESLKSKRKKFDVYICLGLVYMKQENVEKAKSYFKKAYFLNISVPEDQERISQLMKVTLAISDDLRKLSSTDELEEKITLCDKLGDHFVVIKCFPVAIKYYKRELLYATEANKPDVFISKIYVSIGQTYFDNGKFEKAIEYFKHEFNFQLGNMCEQCTSLLKIADIQESLYSITDHLEFEKRETLKNEIIINYETAMKMFDMETLIKQFEQNSQSNSDREKLKLYISVVKNYLNFLQTNKINSTKQDILKDNLSNVNNFAFNDDDDDDDNTIEAETDIANDIYDQYNLDLLSNDSDSAADDEETPENFHSRPKRNPRANLAKSRLNQFGETALHTACIAGNMAQVERLIQQNVDINAKDFCGWTPLHEACNHGFKSIVELLINNGANIEASDNRSEHITPLHDACNCGHLEIITLLLNHGADVMARNSHGETPLECLMSWRERCKNELNKQELDDCLDLENKMINLMKDKGFDLSNLFKRNKSNLSRTAESNYSSVNSNNPSNSIKRRNLVKDLIYSSENSDQFSVGPTDHDDDDLQDSAKEYRNTIESIRHFGSKSNATFKNKNERLRALVDEDEEAPRDDWLIDDLGNRKKARKRNLECHFTANGGTSALKQTAYDHSNKRIKSTNHHEDVINLIDSQQENRHLETKHQDDEFDQPMQNEHEHGNISTVPNGHSNSKDTIIINKSNSSSSIMKANNHNNNNNNKNNRKALTVNFDDIHKSSFIVFIENQCDCKWLKEELTRRYFTHYGMKPLFSLKTDNDAILLDSDLVIDIIDNERTIKAVINSWTIDQPDKRYVELCNIQQIYADIDKNIECSLRKSHKSFYLNLRGLFFPSITQNTLLFKALLQQTIKELDLSFTNLLLNKENYNAFRTMVISLTNLEELYLCGVSFPSNCLIHLINVSQTLRKLDLSFNPLGNESAYSLAQIIITFSKLEYLNLSACDLSEKFLQSNLLMNSIENSNLTTLLLDNNDFPSDLLNTKFKTLNTINRVLIA